MISSEKITNGSTNGVNGSSGCRDGNDYLKVLNKERDRLLATADKLDKEIENLLKAGISDEVIGHLRSATGKARLLSSQKMVQFEGLCHKNLTPPPDDPCPTKIQDLQGFWDMVMLQVENIDRSFADLETMRANGWEIPQSPPPPTAPGSDYSSPSVVDGGLQRVKRVTTASKPATPSPASILAAQKREAQRKQLAELKRQFKMQQQQQKSENGSDDTIIH